MATISALRRQRRQAVPDGILAFRAASHEAERLLKGKFGRQFREVLLHAVAHDEDDFLDARRVVELLPSVGDDRPAGDLQPELVHVGAHAGALAGGNDDGGGHYMKG